MIGNNGLLRAFSDTKLFLPPLPPFVAYYHTMPLPVTLFRSQARPIPRKTCSRAPWHCSETTSTRMPPFAPPLLFVDASNYCTPQCVLTVLYMLVSQGRGSACTARANNKRGLHTPYYGNVCPLSYTRNPKPKPRAPICSLAGRSWFASSTSWQCQRPCSEPNW